jgi:hypothetical protein
MSTPTTVEEWRASLAALEQQMDALQGQLDANRDEFIATGRETTRLKNQLNELQRSGVDRTSDQYVAVQKAYNASFRKEARIEEAKDAIARKMVDLQASINTASIRIAKAEGGIPDTNTTPRPASEQPGGNTSPDPIPETVLPEPKADITEEPEPPQSQTDALIAAQKIIDDSDATIAQYDQSKSNLDEILRRNGIAVPSIPDEPTSEDSDITSSFSSNPEFTAPTNRRATPGQTIEARKQATAQDQYNYSALKDWRVKLRLAPNSNYLYNASPPGILAPLKASEGVIFPYTPSIQIGYSASYQMSDIIHSNFKMYNYTLSSVDNIGITCDFTAQDTFEANYLLAVIHFFKSVTKMFYGKDQDPVNGTPPPVCYLDGYGDYQFAGSPLVITNFTYSLPSDVDYIRATSTEKDTFSNNSSTSGQSQGIRLNASKISPGGTAPPTQWNSLSADTKITYVPTKMQIQIQAIPMISRGDVSKRFSLKDYATGKLGGFW